MDIKVCNSSHASARDITCRILCVKKDSAPLVKDGIHEFSQGIQNFFLLLFDSLRARASLVYLSASLDVLHKLLREVWARYNVKADDIWNMDEQVLGLVVPSYRMLLVSSKKN